MPRPTGADVEKGAQDTWVTPEHSKAKRSWSTAGDAREVEGFEVDAADGAAAMPAPVCRSFPYPVASPQHEPLDTGTSLRQHNGSIATSSPIHKVGAADLVVDANSNTVLPQSRTSILLAKTK